MSIELVPCYTDRALFLRLAKDYIEELREYDGRIRWDEQSVSKWIWEAMFILEDRTIQGFVVTEEVDYKLYRDLLYIAEFFVVPEARRRGVGIGAVKELMKEWHGDLFFYVQHTNFGAKMFWEKAEKEFCWKRIIRPEIRNEDGCDLRVYEQEKYE